MLYRLVPWSLWICNLFIPAGYGQTVSYAMSIQPILNNECRSCHNPSQHTGGLDVSTYSALLQGSRQGPLWSDLSGMDRVRNFDKRWDALQRSRLLKAFEGKLSGKHKSLARPSSGSFGGIEGVPN